VEINVELEDLMESGNFAYMIPQKLKTKFFDDSSILLGARNQRGIALGCALFQKNGRYMDLLWIYTAPEVRRCGVAAEILYTMMAAITFETACLGVMADYDGNRNPELQQLLVKLGFDLSMQKWPVYHFQLEEAAGLKLFARKETGVCALKDCSAVSFAEFMRICQKNRVMLPVDAPFSPEKYDTDVSMVFMKDNQIKGLTLVEAEKDRLYFAYAYIDTECSIMLAVLLGQTFEAAQEKYTGQTEVSTAAISEESEKLLIKLIPVLHQLVQSHAEWINTKS
jgi:hypothetical protein